VNKDPWKNNRPPFHVTWSTIAWKMSAVAQHFLKAPWKSSVENIVYRLREVRKHAGDWREVVKILPFVSVVDLCRIWTPQSDFLTMQSLVRDLVAHPVRFMLDYHDVLKHTTLAHIIMFIAHSKPAAYFATDEFADMMVAAVAEYRLRRGTGRGWEEQAKAIVRESESTWFPDDAAPRLHGEVCEVVQRALRDAGRTDVAFAMDEAAFRAALGRVTVSDGPWRTLPALRDAERVVLEMAARRGNVSDDDDDDDDEPRLDGLSPEQCEAVRTAVRGRCTLVQAEAGTGKTYVIGRIVAHLGAENVLVVTTAHCARMQAQMAIEDAVREADEAGIPRPPPCAVIGDDDYRGPTTCVAAKLLCGRCKSSPAAGRDTLIVDEASFVTLPDLAGLFDAHPWKRVVLVGDAVQLPPIGLGQPFRDMQETGVVVSLTQQFRCRTPDLVAHAKLLRTAEAFPRRAGIAHVPEDDPVGHFRREILPGLRLDDFTSGRVMVVCATNEMVDAIDDACSAHFARDPRSTHAAARKRAGTDLAPRDGLAVGEPVAICRADPRRDKFKNMRGTVVAVAGKLVAVHFPLLGRELKGIHPSELNLAYALTAHKAQGDAADRVYVLRRGGRIFYRNLTYVAATRARRECTFVMPDLSDALVADRTRDTATTLGNMNP
jgi:hypothetical protein